MQPSEFFSTNLNNARVEAGLSREELGERCGLHHIQVVRFEKGAATPSLDTLIKLAGTLDVSVEALCAGVAWDDGARQFIPVRR